MSKYKDIINAQSSYKELSRSFFSSRFISKLFAFALRKLRKRRVVYNFNYYCKEKCGHALLYYKTDQFIYETPYGSLHGSSRGYTSNWEEVEIARILNRLGYWVDIVDRGVSPDFMPEDKYDIFIGNGAGNSGKYYAKYAKQLKKAVKIFYANGPEPELSNSLIEQRYEYINERYPQNTIKPRRFITKVDIDESMKYTDAIFCFGNEFSINSYAKYNKPTYQIIPSTSSFIKTSIDDLYSKSKKKFLYFGGHGNLIKGLDILLDAFRQVDDIDLYICAPYEEDFASLYSDVMEKPNIHYIGFIDVGGPVFNELTSTCGYTIFPSCSEGTATSVVTCMKRGMVPVVTYETGVDLDDFGILIDDPTVEGVLEKVKSLSKMEDEQFYDRITKSYFKAQSYSEDGFASQYEKVIIEALRKFKKYPGESG